jgi:hypothetical protein
MSSALSLLLLFAAPPGLGLLVGLLQLAVYRLLVARGRLPRGAVPFFPILWLRGMVLVVAVGALAGIILGIAGGAPGDGGAGGRAP